MYTNPPEFEFQGAIFKFQTGNKLLSFLVYVLDYEIRHFHFVVVQKQQRNVQKSVMHCAKFLFCSLNLSFFRRSRCRRVVES